MRYFKNNHPYLFWQFVAVFLLIIAVCIDFLLVQKALAITAIFIIVLSPIIISLKEYSTKNYKDKTIKYKELESVVIGEGKNKKDFNYKLPSIENIKSNIDLYESIKSIDKSKLIIPLGKDDQNNRYVMDFDENPNLLVGGLPMYGKTGFVQTILSSLLLLHKPTDLKIMIINSKNSNYGLYSDIPHLEGSIDNNYNKLERIKKEIEYRYTLLVKKSLNNYKDYNTLEDVHPLSRFLLIVDELDDLNYIKDLDYITNKGPKVGVFTIMTINTESKKEDIDLISYNFSYRLSFKVPNKEASIVVLNEAGAEDLVEIGVGLLQTSTNENPTKLRVVYLEKELIQKVLDIWKEKLNRVKNKI